MKRDRQQSVQTAAQRRLETGQSVLVNEPGRQQSGLTAAVDGSPLTRRVSNSCHPGLSELGACEKRRSSEAYFRGQDSDIGSMAPRACVPKTIRVIHVMPGIRA